MWDHLHGINGKLNTRNRRYHRRNRLKVSQCSKGSALHPDIEAFIERHNRVIVLEINRDGQLYGVLRKGSQ